MDTHGVGLSTEVDEYELFRRAIVARDEDAWAAIYERYRPLLVAWARHNSTTAQIGEYYDDIANQAFARAWSALSPQHFDQFSSLAKLLAYLRTCVMAVAIDAARTRNVAIEYFESYTITNIDGYIITDGSRAFITLRHSLSEEDKAVGREILLEYARRRDAPDVYLWRLLDTQETVGLRNLPNALLA
jgi:DNA-directed RNA polymerase specialized sigma24 family protein